MHWRRVALGVPPLLAVAAGTARAHAVGGSRFEAPLPLPVLFAGAGASVALTALLVARAEGVPAAGREVRVFAVGPAAARALRTAARVGFLVCVVAALVAGVAGRQVGAENPATLFAWSVWFRGLALVAVVAGSPWPLVSPWAAAYDGLVRLEGGPVAVRGSYPTALGRWPAVAGFLALLGVAATLTVVPDSPRLTTALVGAYALVMVGGAALYGRAWLRRADPLGVFYGLLGRVAPLAVSRTSAGGYAVAVRAPWQGCLDPVADRALVVFVVAAVYTVSFDGFTNTPRYLAVRAGVREVAGAGTAAGVLLYAAGLIGFVVAFLACVRLVAALGAPRDAAPARAARGFAPTVVPIAAAYEVAHNYPAVVRDAGTLLGLLPGVAPVDPLWWLSVPAFWASQVALVVGGHLLAVVAAHRVAVARYGARARRAHLPLVALMVGYTVLSLWLVSRPVVT